MSEAIESKAVQERPSSGPPSMKDGKKTGVGSVFVSNYPPFSVWNEQELSEFEQVLQSPPAKTTLGLYIHIPFCRKRCRFCYFRVYTDKNSDQIQVYLDALRKEIETYGDKPAIQGRPLNFVYFGGGTPSYIAVKHLEKLLASVKAVMPWDTVEEVTFECEPGTLTQSKVAAYRELGVTRLSLGIENMNDEILRENGRAHETKEIYRCLPWIREQNFDQLNVDLIVGMVNETWDNWRDTVQKTIDVDPDSVTIYQMELPYNTVYSREILSGGESPVADWETKRAWNLYAIEQLQEAGYEISSAYTMVKRRSGQDGGKSRFAYRDALWHGADLLGTGIASFGYLNGIHFQNLSGWGQYLESLEAGKLPLQRAYKATAEERLVRELILQMKLGTVDLSYFRNKFGVDPLEIHAETFEDLKAREMLEVRDGDVVELTMRGLLQVDALLPGFYAPQYANVRYT